MFSITVIGLVEDLSQAFDTNLMTGAAKGAARREGTGVFRRFLTSAGKEGLEDGATEALEALIERETLGDKAEAEILRQSYLDEGYSEEQADQAAAWYYLERIGGAVMAGGLMGGMFEGAGMAVNEVRARVRAPELIRSRQYQSALDAAKTLSESDPLHQYAAKLEAAGKKPKARDVVDLVERANNPLNLPMPAQDFDAQGWREGRYPIQPAQSGTQQAEAGTPAQGLPMEEAGAQEAAPVMGLPMEERARADGGQTKTAPVQSTEAENTLATEENLSRFAREADKENEDIRQILSHRLQLPQAVSDDTLVSKS